MPDETLAHLKKGMSLLLILAIALGPAIAPPSAMAWDSDTVTPIKHVIVIVGENRTFDHLFATYVPKAGETVKNLLSEKIINADGSPGPNFSRALQFSADITGSTTFQLSPRKKKKPYSVLFAPLAGGPSDVCTDNGICNLGDALSSEDGLPNPPLTYYESLTFGGSGLKGKVPDSRISGVSQSPPYSSLPLQVLREQPSAPLLPNVAAGGLQRCSRHAQKPQWLPGRLFYLDRGHGRVEREWKAATGAVL